MQESKSFRLPVDGSRDVIMCGPGTGIAPFRAFLEQRSRDGSSGRNWLFFGEQRRAANFYFEDELLNYHQQGKLHRLDLAFSRDQPEKIYVQDRIRENGAEVWRWLEGGAYFYVCGDAKRMAKDVNQSLIDIAQKHGGMTLDAATEHVNTTLMRTEKRYLRDVY
jgi:sulfite reductase (NADPH) flavoprotein alpha-component